MHARRVRAALGLLALGAALLIGREAHVSQVHYMRAPLAEVHGGATWIVVGKIADPPCRNTEIEYPIVNDKGEAITGRYGVSVDRVQVLEVLRPAGQAAPEQPIEVYSPEMVSGLYSHLLYETTGVMESPIYSAMEGGVYAHAAEHAAGAIYLLRAPHPVKDQGEYAAAFEALDAALAGAHPLVVSGAVLGLDRRAELEALLKSTPGPDGG